jgi:hypothetical protein
MTLGFPAPTVPQGFQEQRQGILGFFGTGRERAAVLR